MLKARETIVQIADEMSIKIVNRVLSADYVHTFAEILPHITVSDFVKITNGKSSKKSKWDSQS